MSKGGAGTCIRNKNTNENYIAPASRMWLLIGSLARGLYLDICLRVGWRWVERTPCGQEGAKISARKIILALDLIASNLITS